jgi:hypothetical protein
MAISMCVEMCVESTMTAYLPFGQFLSSSVVALRLKLKGPVSTLAKRIPSWIGVLEPLDERHSILSVGAPTPEALTAFMLMAGVDFQLLDAKDLLPRLREVAARLKRGLGQLSVRHSPLNRPLNP